MHVIHLGRCLGGFPGLAEKPAPFAPVECEATDEEFVFRKSGYEIGRIRRDCINEVVLEHSSKIGRRLSAMRMAFRGFFALAVPKTKKRREYYLVAIDWNDATGVRQNTVFRFTGLSAQTLAYKAAEAFRKP